MILSVGSENRKVNFGQNYTQDTLLPNNIKSKLEMDTNNLVNAFTVYPAKGLRGSKNSNFHEFLTMGMVPYLVGSATLVGISMACNKFLKNSDLKFARKYTKIAALGVIFYGLLKKCADGIINTSAKALTGIDPQIPYAKINYQLKERPGEKDSVSLEYHRVGESIDYPYWALLYGEGDDINKTFDKIAKKNGFGENLNDSDQEIKPLYKEVLAKTTFAKNIVSYLWAATGVALASQTGWQDFDFSRFIPKFKNLKNDISNFGFGKTLIKNVKDFISLIKDFGKTSAGTVKSLWKEKFGKMMIVTSIVTLVLGIANVGHLHNKPDKKKQVIDDTQESMEC